jgi:thiol-disulfide isomerase/thioredoxin
VLPTHRSVLAAACAIALTAGVAHAGSAAPPFSLKGLDGKTIKSSEFRGRPVVLDFWATWCAPCRASMPHLDAMEDRYQKQGLVVIGVSLDELPAARVQEYAKRLGVGFRLGMASERILVDYGPLRSIPTTYFINRKGDVVRRVVGYIDEETMETYVRELF